MCLNFMNPVQFSIVVPVYCVEAFLPRAIESVLAQDFADWELILVDDGSPDDCGKICDKYAERDARIQVIHQENGGTASARMTGIGGCNGRYVLNLDGDDYWEKNLLSELQSVIEQYSPDCISFGYRRVTEEGEIIAEICPKVQRGFYYGESKKKILDKLLYDTQNPVHNTGNMIYSQGCSAFRREIVEPFQKLVPKNIKMGEDAAVTIPSMCQCESIYILDKNLYNYLARFNSVSYSFFLSSMKETLQLVNHFKKYADQVPTENIEGFLYREAENYWVKAASVIPDYRQFKSCVVKSLDGFPQKTLAVVSTFPLCLKSKLRLLIVKKNCWYLFWLFYHNRKSI